MHILLANPAARESLSNGFERYFIKAGSRWPWSYKKRRDEACRPPFPFFIAYTASVLSEAKFNVYVIDGVALNMDENEFMGKAVALKPGLIVMETAMHAFNYDAALAKNLKTALPESLIAFSGPFATVYAEKILSDYRFIDYALLGEFEYTTRDLAKSIRAGNPYPELRGLAFRNGDNVWISTEKGFIEDINQLPSPAFSLFPSNDKPDISCYSDGICTYMPAATLHSSRGCPFTCDFCLWNQVMYSNRKYRTFKPERVVDEMETVIREYGAREIYFDDDDFCVSKKHVLSICSEIQSRGLNIKWSCMGDAMNCDEEMIRSMAQSGCIFMKFGVESGDENILKNISKPLKPERAIQVSEWCRKYGIMTHATFVFGLYGDTPQSMQKTLDLANRIKFDYAQASIATPFPGTRMFERLVADGAIKELDFTKFDGTQTCVFDTDTLTADQVVAFRKKAIRSMILHKATDPAWWRNYLRRNRIIAREYGLGHIWAPIKAFMRL